MGLTGQNTGFKALDNEFTVKKISECDKVIALAGNPNVGKSTVFNNLTGLKQHTGNWPGKTVTNAQGYKKFNNENFVLIDLPGTYSLMANSEEEEIARDFICFGNPDATVIVADATCLERNLNLVLQTLEITKKAVVCINLIDEAKKKKIVIDYQKLSEILKVPVIPANARSNKGLTELMQALSHVCRNENEPIRIVYDHRIEEAIGVVESRVKELAGKGINPRWIALRLIDGDISLKSMDSYLGVNLSADCELTESLRMAKDKLIAQGISDDILRDMIVSALIHTAEETARETVTFARKNYDMKDRRIDKFLTSKVFGIPVMLLMLGVILWITITGANYPSKVIAKFLFYIEDRLTDLFQWLSAPSFVYGILVLGVYRTLAWVVSVMLPPMAIFFPLFTLLEDLGYLPRIAFNLDNFFKKACCHGKQALTMCMGFGCNAAGIIGCRIIDSPREKLIAMITNNFVPCNGRFPALIAIITMFFAGFVIGPLQSVISALMLTGVILLGIIMTLVVSRILSKTILKGIPSSFTLELPPYRRPQIGKVIIRSIFDRTLFVLGRAVLIAAPAGMVIWLMANIHINDISILRHIAGFINPVARIMGLDGYILTAFILGFPANEIVIPIIIMSYMAEGSILELDSLTELRTLLINNGWTWLTAVSVMLFSLMHWPCGTTCITIKKETGSWKWTIVSFLIPTITGFIFCCALTGLSRLFGFV